MKTIQSAIEPLEPRIAPAIIFTFTEFDGDLVTVSISKGAIGDLTALFPPVPGLFGGQLTKIDLGGNQVFAGADITITAKPQLIANKVRGDGLVNVGFIDASGGGGIDLGAVKINGDLAKILVGDATLDTPGVKSLSVFSLGRFGTATGATDLTSIIKGKLGSVSVRTDVTDATVRAGSFGPITVGGSVSGGGSVDSFGSVEGTFDSDGDIGLVKITGNLLGGSIKAGGKIAGVTIGGKFSGASFRGVISSAGDMGPVKIGGDVIGSGGDVGGGVFVGSGNINCGGNLARVTIGGSLRGSTFNNSGSIFCAFDIGPVKVGQNMQGIGSSTGFIEAHGKLASVAIGGSVIGSGSGTGKAYIRSLGDMGPVTIRGSFESSGGFFGTEISSGGTLGAVKIGGDVVGTNTGSAFIHTTNGGAIASVTIGGSLIGGMDGSTGRIFTTGAIGPVKIGGDVDGRAGGPSSGVIEAGSVASVTIGGSLIGGSQPDTGEIFVRGMLGPVKIGGDIRGGTGIFTGYIQGDRVPSVFVGGSIVAGATDPATPSGSIRAFFDIGSITVRGSLLRSQVTPPIEGVVVIAAQGNPLLAANAPKDVAIGKISIGGNVEHAQILAGFTAATLAPANADAQIGSVTVKGDWIASSLIAGVAPGGDGMFGTSDDAKMSGGVKDTDDALGAISKIGKVIIKGAALGTIASGDNNFFGIEAQQLGSIKTGGTIAPLHAGPSNDLFANRIVLGPTRTPSGDGFDFHAFEVL